MLRYAAHLRRHSPPGSVLAKEEVFALAHTAELIAVGTELLLGNIANTDAQMISEGLSALGINVYYHTVVGDNPERLKAAIEIARKRADILITTGGLGPTCDDLTKQTLAEVFGRKLLFHPETAERIRRMFRERFGVEKEITENNFQQAMLPEGCEILVNDWGTAPGVAFEQDGTHVVMLPGPPNECAPMFRYRAVPYLQQLSDGMIVSRSLRIFGAGESAVEALLRERMNELTNPTLAPYAKTGEVELRITAKAEDEETARAMLAPVEREVREKLGAIVYGTDVHSLEEEVLHQLQEKGLTLGTAESCTGGLIAKRITDLPGASKVFRGGVVSYCDEVKANVLGVPEKLLKEKGAVSPEVAKAMAEGTRTALGCDLAVASTGVAGPGPDDRGNPEGLVYLALATGEGTFLRVMEHGRGRERIRVTAGHHAFDMVRRYLTGLPVETI